MSLHLLLHSTCLNLLHETLHRLYTRIAWICVLRLVVQQRIPQLSLWDMLEQEGSARRNQCSKLVKQNYLRGSKTNQKNLIPDSVQEAAAAGTTM